MPNLALYSLIYPFLIYIFFQFEAKYVNVDGETHISFLIAATQSADKKKDLKLL